MALPKIVNSKDKYSSTSSGTGLQGKLANIPNWVWYAGGAVIAIAIVMILRRNGGTGSPLSALTGGNAAGSGSQATGSNGTTSTSSVIGGSSTGSSSPKLPITAGSTSSGFVLASSSRTGHAAGTSTSFSENVGITSSQGAAPVRSTKTIGPPTITSKPGSLSSLFPAKFIAATQKATPTWKQAKTPVGSTGGMMSSIAAAIKNAQTTVKKSAPKTAPKPKTQSVGFGTPGGGVAPPPKHS